MRLQRIRLEKFRMFRELEANFGEGLNLITGENGQGKTSLLEAIYLLSATRSFRTNDYKEMISSGFSYSAVSGDLISQRGDEEIIYRLKASLTEEGKVFSCDSVNMRIAEFYGILGCVVLTNSDMSMVRGAPEDRRRFLDRAMSSTVPLYIKNLLKYRRILKQRNALLRDGVERRIPLQKLKSSLHAWDRQLIDNARLITDERERFIDGLKETVNEVYSELFEQSCRVELIYESSFKKKV